MRMGGKVLCCILVCSVVSSAVMGGGIEPTSAHPGLADFFPYGAMHMATIPHWQHYLPPIDEYIAYMNRDMAKMKEVGFNSIAVHVDWYDIEPAAGEFNFERLDRVVALAEKHGLKIVPWPWAELQPDWVGREFSDGQWQSVIDFKPGPACWDHPEVRKLTARFVRTVIDRYKDRSCVLAWDVGAEAGIWVCHAMPVDRNPVMDLYCYCQHTKARYRDWLKNKYGTLERLNEVWSTYHREWSEVEPVRAGTFERAQVYWLDWRRFMCWSTAEFQRLKVDAARAADPTRPITCHLGGWGRAYVHQAVDEYQIAQHFDIVGLSFFPLGMGGGDSKYDPSMGAIQLDGIRSASGGKPMWIEEMQGGPSIFGLKFRSRFPTSNDLRLWNWQSLAHGASGVFYWNWRPETTGIEAGGFGLVNYDGSLTERAREAGRMASEFNRHAQRLLSSRPVPAEVAILHDPRTAIQAHGEQDPSVPLASERGVYKAFYRSHIPVDFLVPEQLMSVSLSKYKTIYLPFAYILSPEEGQRLTAYVEQGGYLFGGLWCGLKDERTFLYEEVPGAGLARLFGCKETEVSPISQGDMIVEPQQKRLTSFTAGAKIPAYRFRETLDLLPGAEVVARFEDQSPAIISRRQGKGSALYVGTMLCQHYDITADANSKQVLLDFASQAGVKPPVEVDIKPALSQLEARVLEGPAGRTLILLNHGYAGGEVKITLPTKGHDEISDLLTGKAMEVAREGEYLILSLTVPARDVRVLACK